MNTSSIQSFVLAALMLLTATPTRVAAAFQPLFDGKTLKGWKFVGTSNQGIAIADQTLVMGETVIGGLFTEKQYENFTLRFDFRPGTNAVGAIAVRSPFYGEPVMFGLKIPLADDRGPRSAGLRSDLYTGSLAEIAPAQRGALRTIGEWNAMEIRLEGRWLSVTLNNRDILTVNLNDLKDPELLAAHPGVLRTEGHIGLIADASRIEYRNLAVEELPSKFARTNAPPYPGFLTLYNGVDLSGWAGQLKEPEDNPARRALLPSTELKRRQTTADLFMQAHWNSVNGVLACDGQGRSIRTLDDYQDFELFVDWKIGPKVESGIGLRGCPQVQIWDPFHPSKSGSAIGSGGLSKNERGPSKPLSVADRPPGEWNRFQILMQGNRVTVFLNGELVTHNVVLENAWDRAQPVLPSGPILLQHHGGPLWFRNIYLRPL